MIEHLIQELIDALNRNTAAVTAFTLPTAAPAKRTRTKPTTEEKPELTEVPADCEVLKPLPEPAETPTPEVPATVEPEPEPAGTPVTEDGTVIEPAAEITHDQILNIVREFRKGLDTTNYAKSKADLKVVLDRFGIEALSKADKKDLPELLTAVQAICQ